jgi:transposase-like protein
MMEHGNYRCAAEAAAVSDELRERAVRMVFEVRRETGESHGVITRVARDLGVGAESLRGWVSRAEIDSGNRPGTSTVDAQRISELEIATCRWVSWFNEHRLHGELDDLTPAEVEAAYYRDLRQAEAA